MSRSGDLRRDFEANMKMLAGLDDAGNEVMDSLIDDGVDTRTALRIATLLQIEREREPT